MDFVKSLEKIGVGEIMLTSIDNEGTYKGYDDISFDICNLLNIPVSVNGGASSFEEMIQAVRKGASAAVAGSLFAYYGNKRGVLPNYPSQNEMINIFKQIPEISIKD